MFATTSQGPACGLGCHVDELLLQLASIGVSTFVQGVPMRRKALEVSGSKEPISIISPLLCIHVLNEMDVFIGQLETGRPSAKDMLCII